MAWHFEPPPGMKVPQAVLDEVEREIDRSARAYEDALTKTIRKAVKDEPPALSYRDKLRAYLLEFDPDEHPRGDDGKFVEKGTGEATAEQYAAEKAKGRVAKFTTGDTVVLKKKDGKDIRVDTTDVDDPAALHDIFATVDPEEVMAAMFGEFTGDVTSSISAHASTYSGSLKVRISGYDEAGNTITRQFERTPTRTTSIGQVIGGQLTVDHAFFELTESMQGKDVAKKILRDSMDLYERMGVNRITVHANIDVGGYAWARFGFTAADPQAFAEAMREQIDYKMSAGPNRRAAEALVRQYENDPKAPWHLAGLVSENGDEIGKSIMIDSDWSGRFDMHDPEQMQRFRSYVNKPSKPRKRHA